MWRRLVFLSLIASVAQAQVPDSVPPKASCDQSLGKKELDYRRGRFQTLMDGGKVQSLGTAFEYARSVVKEGSLAEILEYFGDDNLERFFLRFEVYFYQAIQRQTLQLSEDTAVLTAQIHRMHSVVQGLEAHSVLDQLVSKVANASPSREWSSFISRYRNLKKKMFERLDGDPVTQAELMADIEARSADRGARAFLRRHVDRFYQEILAFTHPKHFVGVIAEVEAWMAVCKTIAIEAVRQGISTQNDSRAIDQQTISFSQRLEADILTISDQKVLVKSSVNKLLLASEPGLSGLGKYLSGDLAILISHYVGLKSLMEKILNVLPQLRNNWVVTRSATPGAGDPQKTEILLQMFAAEYARIRETHVSELFDAIQRNDIDEAIVILRRRVMDLSGYRTAEGESLVSIAESAKMMRLLYSYMHPES
jgi:hypothetical protein